MNEIYTILRDLGPVGAILIQCGIAWLLFEVRRDVKIILVNHLPHIDSRLARLEGRQEQRDHE